MIFKTFDNGLNGIINKMGIFNKSFATISRDYKKGNSIFTSIFSGKNITKNDIESIQAMDVAMQNGKTYAQAWTEHMQGATTAAKEHVAQCLKNKESLSELAVGLKQSTMAAKAGQLAMQGLAMAGNMIAMWAITEVISWAVKGIDEFIHAAENARKKSTELTTAWSEENDILRDCITKYSDLQKKMNDSSITTEEFTSAKEDLLSVQQSLIEKFGDEAKGIDLVNGKYDEQIQKLRDLDKASASEHLANNAPNITSDRIYVNQSFAGRKVNLKDALIDTNTEDISNVLEQQLPDQYEHINYVCHCQIQKG